ncbi:DDB1- and CUL4-associated factor 1-like, partial [Anarrhichthys ocellatus]|uniref:DDB1- and CUL4-associated factor 1-like n=1 Tax=Anarrhichthys ocellatus TaxID=433405 RepID=UPI0012EE6871
MFFSIAFSFRAVLQLFDHQDGLRRLVNLVSTLEILTTQSEVSIMSDDQVFANRQTAKHTCMALRRYFEAQLAVKAEQVKQSLHTSDEGTVVPQQPFYKVPVICVISILLEQNRNEGSDEQRGVFVCVCVCVC